MQEGLATIMDMSAEDGGSAFGLNESQGPGSPRGGGANYLNTSQASNPKET